MWCSGEPRVSLSLNWSCRRLNLTNTNIFSWTCLLFVHSILASTFDFNFDIRFVAGIFPPRLFDPMKCDCRARIIPVQTNLALSGPGFGSVKQKRLLHSGRIFISWGWFLWCNRAPDTRCKLPTKVLPTNSFTARTLKKSLSIWTN